MGNLFYRGQSIPEINRLRYAEMKEWNDWHELMCEAEKKAAEASKGKK
jgi:hypothetical protein